MTKNDDPRARCALFVAFEGMGLLDLTGPLTVFWSASKFMEQQGRHGYARHTVSLDGGPILTAEGVTIETAPISEERRVGKECRALCRSRWSPYH